MMMDDHKKAITIMMSKRNSDGKKTMDHVPMKDEVSKTEDGEMDGRHVAAQDIMAAHHDQSPQKLMEALAHFIDIHHAQKDSVVE